MQSGIAPGSYSAHNDAQSSEDIVTSVTEPRHIAELLNKHGCKDFTSLLNRDACSTLPYAGGGYGDVYRGELEDGTLVAIKTVRQYEHEIAGASAGKFYKRLAKELYTWSKCNHPNVMKLLGWAIFNDSLAMVSRWMEHGNLSRYAEAHPSSDRYLLSAHVCRGIVYLHQEKLVHGDIKAANILVSPEGIPMLTDFGNASIRYDATLRFTKTTTEPGFSVRWAAPEVVLNGQNPTTKSDIYSLGMTILEVITGASPFAGVQEVSIGWQLMQKKIPSRPENIIPPGSIAGDKLWDLLKQCWAYEPNMRPQASNVYETLQMIRDNRLPLPRHSDQRQPISSATKSNEIINVLSNHGCVNLTGSLNESACRKHPVASGSLCDIFRGKLLDGTAIAIKTIRAYYDQGQLIKVYDKQAAREIYTWSKCKHPNVVKLLGLAVFRGSLAMISRWEQNGDLLKYLSHHPDADRCQLSKSICAGLRYLHENNIVHGDLKGANVLIAQDGTPMLMDFGDASKMDVTLQFTQTQAGQAMSMRWTAPEIIRGKTTRTDAGDIYALGMVTILEALTGTIPYPKEKDQSVLAGVFQKKIPARPARIIPKNSVSGDILWAILTRCWSHNPKCRPSAEVVWKMMDPITTEMLKEIEDEPEEIDAEGDD